MRGRGESVRALAEIDLVDIELEYLVLGEAVLDLEREQHLVKFARKGFFLGQKKIARNLHGDGAGTLARPAGHEIRQRGANDTDIIDPAVLVKPLVLGREYGLAHLLGHGCDLDHRAPLLPELPDQQSLAAIYAERNLGLIVGQNVDIRKRRPDNYYNKNND